MAGHNHIQLVPVVYKQSTLSLQISLGNLSPVLKCLLGVQVGSDLAVLLILQSSKILTTVGFLKHTSDSMNPLFCFVFNILFSYSFLSKIFYLRLLEDTNKCPLWSAKVNAWWWCRGHRNTASALVSFSVYECQKIHRWLFIRELQNMFTGCQLARVLTLCFFSPVVGEALFNSQEMLRVLQTV